MLSVYFACSIRGGRDDAAWYAEIVTLTKQHATVLTEIFADKTLSAEGMKQPAGEIWSNDMRWIEQADVIIAEVTQASLGVGYEIARAEKLGKPILCLYRPQPDKKLSAMIAGSPHASIFEYTSLAAADHAIQDFLATVQPSFVAIR